MEGSHCGAGGSEYWFASIKVVMIILFIVVCLIMTGVASRVTQDPYVPSTSLGATHRHAQGLSNFYHGQASIGGFSGFA